VLERQVLAARFEGWVVVELDGVCTGSTGPAIGAVRRRRSAWSGHPGVIASPVAAPRPQSIAPWFADESSGSIGHAW
jgi:hypothetical protein